MNIRTVTLQQIRDFKVIRDMAAEWRGSLPLELREEFDEGINDATEAIKQVELDRKRLRAALTVIEVLSETDIAEKNSVASLAAWYTLQRLLNQEVR